MIEDVALDEGGDATQLVLDDGVLGCCCNGC